MCTRYRYLHTHKQRSKHIKSACISKYQAFVTFTRLENEFRCNRHGHSGVIVYKMKDMWLCTCAARWRELFNFIYSQYIFYMAVGSLDYGKNSAKNAFTLEFNYTQMSKSINKWIHGMLFIKKCDQIRILDDCIGAFTRFNLHFK